MELKIENIEEYDFINNLTHKTPEQKAALKAYEATAGKVKKSGEQRPWVREVDPADDDVIEAGGYKFNWRQAYDNVKEERLGDSEEDAKKLNDFINSNLYTFNDKSDIRDKAKDLHLWNPSTEKWTDFIQSERGDEFQKYLLDAQKAQQEKRVNEIWSGKDGNKFTNLLTDFMAPVSKEYGKKNYENINVEDIPSMYKDMAGPLLADYGSNLIMTGLGSGLIKKAIPKIPQLSWLYGNVAAPVVTEGGNVVFNDQSIPEGLARTGEGVAINMMTPALLKSGVNRLGGGGSGNKKVQQDLINEAANQARIVQKRMNDGAIYPVIRQPAGHVRVDNPPRLYTQLGKKDILPSFTKKKGALLPEISRKRGKTTIYSTDPARSKTLTPRGSRSDYVDYNTIDPKNAQYISGDEILAYKEGIPLLRGKNPAGGLTSKKGAPKRYDTTIKSDKKWLGDDKNKKVLLDKAEKSLFTHKNLSGLTGDELRRYEILLGKGKGITPKYDKESFSNYLLGTIDELAGDVPATYATNMLGRPYAGRRMGPVRLWNNLLGEELDMEFFKKDASPEEAQLSRILKMLEKEHPYIAK